MLHLLTCSNGHSWETSATDVDRAVCPVCGDAVESLPLFDLAVSNDPVAAAPAAPQAVPLRNAGGKPVVAGFEIEEELVRGLFGVRQYQAKQLLVNRRVLLQVVVAREDAGQRGWGAFAAKPLYWHAFVIPISCKYYNLENRNVGYFITRSNGSKGRRWQNTPNASRCRPHRRRGWLKYWPVPSTRPMSKASFIAACGRIAFGCKCNRGPPRRNASRNLSKRLIGWPATRLACPRSAVSAGAAACRGRSGGRGIVRRSTELSGAGTSLGPRSGNWSRLRRLRSWRHFIRTAHRPAAL